LVNQAHEARHAAALGAVLAFVNRIAKTLPVLIAIVIGALIAQKLFSLSNDLTELILGTAGVVWLLWANRLFGRFSN
jgi:hypothetical protein